MTFLLDEEEISIWSYDYCKHIKNDPKVRKHITDSRWAYCYCKFIKDDPEVRKNITLSGWAYCYCRDIKDDLEVRKNINDPELKKLIKKGEYKL